MRRSFLAPLLLALDATSLAAHDPVLKPFDFFVVPGSETRVRVLNGTFREV